MKLVLQRGLSESATSASTSISSVLDSENNEINNTDPVKLKNRKEKSTFDLYQYYYPDIIRDANERYICPWYKWEMRDISVTSTSSFKTTLISSYSSNYMNQLKTIDKQPTFDLSQYSYPEVTRNAKGRFICPWYKWEMPGFTKIIAYVTERSFRMSKEARMKRKMRTPKDQIERELYLPIVDPNDDNNENTEISFQWIGHASCLVSLDGYTVLTDPVFSNACSPEPLPFPKRMTPVPFSLEALFKKTTVDAVLISHDHYDHLDLPTIRKIEELSGEELKYFVPLGMKKYITQNCKVHPEKIVEMGWWDEHEVDVSSESSGGKKVQIACAPAQHWCNRNSFDMNKRLWCSFAVTVTDKTSSATKSFYFAGDTAYSRTFPLHKQIGERYGPFDIAAIPIGAYDPVWFTSPQHCTPEEGVWIHNDVKSKCSVGIHWGTWDLANETWFEPPMRMKEEVARQGLEWGIDAMVLRHGERVQLPVTESNTIPLHPLFSAPYAV